MNWKRIAVAFVIATIVSQAIRFVAALYYGGPTPQSSSVAGAMVGAYMAWLLNQEWEMRSEIKCVRDIDKHCRGLYL